jgi:ABC-type lipoprotein export system ATPase subunit
VIRDVTAWLNNPAPESTLCAIVGDAGSGKSAVLARIVVTADPARRQRLGMRLDPNTIPAA